MIGNVIRASLWLTFLLHNPLCGNAENPLPDTITQEEQYKRDIERLTDQLKAEPENAKLIFELAQAYQLKNCPREALEWYQKRIDKGGAKEELWGSMYKMAEIYDAMGFWDQALLWYQRAYQDSPHRAEPLLKIAHHYRTQGQCNLAYLYAKQGSQIPLPTGNQLLLEPNVYHHQFDEELSIAAFYTTHKDEGHAATERLILKKGIPDHAKNQAYRNMIHYAPFLEGATIREIKFNLPRFSQDKPETYLPLNPSIRKTADGYRVICRTTNYERVGERNFKSRDPQDGMCRTRNFIIDIDPELNVRSQKEIVESVPRKWRFWAEGLEDCRLFAYQQHEWFTCATSGTHPCTIGQSLCKLSDDQTSDRLAVDQLIPLKGPNDGRCEKNWLPLVKDGQLYMLYSYDPFTVFKINPLNGEYETVVSYTPHDDLSHFRGSAAPVPFENGYLVLVHEVVFDQKYVYMHRFLQLDNDFKILAMSRPFFYKHKAVEYCCGMTIDHSGRNLLMTIGVDDKEAYFVTIAIDKVKSMLSP